MQGSSTTKGIVFDLKKFAIHDGPGIRTTIFMKGCPLQCIWCHNPESQKLDPEVIVKVNRRKTLDLSYSETKDVIGREVTVEEIMSEVKKDIDYYDQSGGGVTFSGGEPMMQPEFLNALLIECKKLEINTAVDTCGHAAYESFEIIIDKVDTFLYDLKLMDNEEHVKYTGVGNKIILENLNRLASNGKNIKIRIPIIPGITDTEKNLQKMIKFLKVLNTVNDVSLLKYNKLGEGKEEKLNMVQRLKNVESPSDERMEELKLLFVENGFNCKIGG
ncbi:glycyl-radical enzyme activating protein [Bacteroidota bacterium]